MTRAIVQRQRLYVALVLAAALATTWARAQEIGPSAATAAIGAATTKAATTPAAPVTPVAQSGESEAVPPQAPLKCRFEELFRVSLRDRRLEVLMTPPAALDEAVRAGRGVAVTIADADDEIDWELSGVPAARQEDGAYARFTVSPPAYHVPDRWSPLRLTSVTRDEKSLYVTGSGRVGGGRTFVSVHFWQQQPLSAVRLTVQRSRRAGVGRPLHDFSAGDLLQMFNEHQREVRLYLAPLLRTVTPQTQGLLRPRAGDVYRVFADIPADAAAVRQVQAILPELDAASPEARQAASAKIEAVGPAGVLAILRMDRSEWTPEQSARLSEIVRRHSTYGDPPAWRRDIYFLTDCLADGDPAVRRAALAELRAIAGASGETIHFDLDASAHARNSAAAAILRTLESAGGK